MRSPAACLLCCGSLGPVAPGWLAFAQAGLSAQAAGCSSYRASSYGSGGVAANQSRMAA